MKISTLNLLRGLGTALVLVLGNSHSAKAVEAFVEPAGTIAWSQVVNSAAGPTVYDRDYYNFDSTHLCTLTEPNCTANIKFYSHWSKAGIQFTYIASSRILTGYTTESYLTCERDQYQQHNPYQHHDRDHDDRGHDDPDHKKHNQHDNHKHVDNPGENLLGAFFTGLLGGGRSEPRTNCHDQPHTKPQTNTREVPKYRDENIKAAPQSLQFSIGGQSFTYTSGPVSPELANALANAPDDSLLLQMVFEDGKKENALIGKGTVRAWKQIFK
jgi:hypothetical protein